jgi:dipeptidyl-peptidase 4
VENARRPQIRLRFYRRAARYCTSERLSPRKGEERENPETSGMLFGMNFFKNSFVALAALPCFFSAAPAQDVPQQKELTIEAIFAEGGISGRAPEFVQWSPDGKKLSFVQRDQADERGELWYADPSTGEKKLLVSEARMAGLAPPIGATKNEREKERVTRYHVAQYQWAPDSRHLLFNSQGQLWLYDTDNSTAVALTSAPEPSADPKFSPDGARLAYVREHNLYVRPLSGKREKQLTKDNAGGNQLNGEVDWVYAEELSVRSNYFWSPDGGSIAYLQMDEGRVPSYPITDWLGGKPRVEMQRYPNAGDPNPGVRLGVVAASGGKTRWVELADKEEIYIPRFGWVRDGVLWAEVLNREQTKMDLYFIDARSGHSKKVLTESDPEGWINVNDVFRVLNSGDRFLWSSWRDGHTQIYLYSFDKANPTGADAKLERQLTQGGFEVFSVDGVDEAAGVMYFSSNQGDPRQQQLYSVKLDGSELTKLSREEGVHEAAFAKNGKLYADSFSSYLKPPRLAACDASGGCKPVWESRNVEHYKLRTPEALEFKAEDGTRLLGSLLLPENPGAAKIPLIIYVYGGPAAQVVRDVWEGSHGEALFHQAMAARGFAVFSVDNRGTPGRDRKFQTAIRHQFGGIELKDQLTALDQLLARYPQLDPKRVGTWGWSNGGYMTLYGLTHSDRFAAGFSVAPVSDWHYYDSIYTERYLGLPKENTAGYAKSSTVKAAMQLHGSLAMAHGTSDDNVHMQNSIEMLEALIRAGKPVSFMPYPGKTHGIDGSADKIHLFRMIEQHFERELQQK